jgi:hypothetical protein
MKRIIVDYSKLNDEILNLLVEKFPDGYDDSNIIRFRNAHNELIEAVEVRTDDTVYLVKVSTKLASRLEKFEEDDDLDAMVEHIDSIKAIDEDEDALDPDADEEEVDLTKDPGGSDDDEEEEEDDYDDGGAVDDEDEEDEE